MYDEEAINQMMQPQGDPFMGPQSFYAPQAMGMGSEMDTQQEDTGVGLSTVIDLLFLIGMLGSGQGAGGMGKGMMKAGKAMKGVGKKAMRGMKALFTGK